MKKSKVVAICLGVVAICAPSAQADGASEHSVASLLPFEALSDDGVALRGHVYLPDGEGPFGTVLEYSPYWNTNGGYGQSDGMIVEQDGRHTLGLWLGRYLDAGFAVALVNIRGSGESDGCFQFGLPRDWSDVYSVVETLADQPWSNGKIGMTGLSYPGWTQYMALASKPPSLKAVIPVSGVIDPWNLWGRHGASARTDQTFSPLHHAVFAGTSATGVLALTSFVPDTRVSHFACPDYAGDSFENAAYGVQGDRTGYWRTQDLRPHIAGSTVPTFFANGLGGDGHILQFDGLWELLDGPKRMLIGQWGHENPDEAGYAGFEGMTVAWMDRYLRDGPEVVEPGVVDYQDDTGVWNTADQWPPPGTHVPLYLSDGAIVASPDEVTASSVTFTSEMQDPQPDNCPGGTSVYVSPPLAHDVLLAGNYEADLTVSSTMPDGNLGVLLYHRERLRDCATEVLPNYFTEGPGGRIGQALTDLRHARGDEGGSLFPIGEPTAVHAMSHPFASRVRAGERLVLSIGGGANELQPDSTTSVLTVTTGPGYVGRVDLLVVEGELGFVVE